MNHTLKKYLLYFAQEHVDFRFAEINSLLKLSGSSMKFVEEPPPLQPFWLVEFPSEQEAITLANRSVSLRCCIELWGSAGDMQTLHGKLKDLQSSILHPILQPEKSFKINVISYGKHLIQKEKVKKLQTFGYLPLSGPVSLINPDVTLQYLEYYGIDSNNPPENPYAVFFGRKISDGARALIKKQSLKTRKFIGNTSMDPQLALLMANQALVQPGDLVLDPFVGSGSLLVSVAQFGGFVFGADIDFLMLHGKNKPSRIRQKKREGESVEANLRQYGIEEKYLDVLVNDFSIPVWRPDLQFDAIITDPPYGIREPTEKIGIHKGNYTIKEEHIPTHIPAKVEYDFPQIYQDLLKFSAKHLKSGGRLVCWFPVLRNDNSAARLPSHPCLELVANSEQVLSNYMSRRLLTYQKTEEPSATTAIITDNSIRNFRQSFYKVRIETRKERRLKEAQLREKYQINAEQKIRAIGEDIP